MRMLSIGLVFLILALRCGAQDQFVDWARDKTCQTVFHAVLQGLYDDGVSNEAVDLIIPPGDKQFSMHFVYACPLCHPAYEAFRLYRQRPNFYGRKDDADTFGGELDEATMKKLRDKDKLVRLDAIQELIQKWVGRRLDSMRLTSDERTEWSYLLTARLKMGMLAMEKSPEFGAKECAICLGSVEGAIRPAAPAKPQRFEPKPVRPPQPPVSTPKEF